MAIGKTFIISAIKDVWLIIRHALPFKTCI